MLKKSIFLLAGCLAMQHLPAQLARETLAQGYFLLGSFHASQTNALSTSFQPAALASLDRTSAGLYGEKRFLLQEMGFYRYAIALHTNSGNVGFNGHYSGSPEFNSLSAGLAYGRALGDKVAAGLQFEYAATKLKGYGQVSYINVHAGTIINISEQLHAGLQVKNLAGLQSKTSADELKPQFTIGLGYAASEQFYAAMAFQKEGDQPNDILAMVQYRFLPQINFKLGISTQVPVLYGGLSFNYKNLQVDLLSHYHQHLGITPGLALHYQFAKQEE